MFLDEELYQVAKSADWSKWMTKSKVETDMALVVLGKIKQLFDSNTKTISLLSPEIKRMENAWNLAVKRLKKEGISITYTFDELRSELKNH